MTAARRLPPKSERLSPALLGSLFKQPAFVSPDHPKKPISEEARQKMFTALPLEKQKALLRQAAAQAEEAYTKATGYGLHELVPWPHAIQLITGTNRPSTAETRLRSYFPMRVQVKTVKRPKTSGCPIYLILNGEPEVRCRKIQITYKTFVTQHQVAGFTATLLV
jgi:hypothetical protein